MLDNALLSVEISFCQSEMIAFCLTRNLMQFDPKIRDLEVNYHAGFRKNKSVFMQNDCGFKRYHVQEKFIFQQLVAKFANFADFR